LNFKYIALRILRHFMPESAARLLLKRRWILRPGLESTDPVAAADRYVRTLSARGISIEGKRVLIFGYGGRFGVGVELLRQGVKHVVLCDHYVLLDKERNLQLLSKYADYLMLENGEAKPRRDCITLLHGDVRDRNIQKQISQVDCVLSTSVYEHLGDVAGITHALANLTAPLGIHLHFVDLRDHYFKYPFEMLTYSSRIWKWFLNPTSNLNRFLLPDDRQVFDENFQSVEIEVQERMEDEFEAARVRIRPEFKTGDASIDAVAQIQVIASEPVRQRS
jgi:hypothetical protein